MKGKPHLTMSLTQTDDEYFYVVVDEFTGVEIDTMWHDDKLFTYGEKYETTDVIGTVSKIVYESSHTRRVFIRELI